MIKEDVDKLMLQVVENGPKPPTHFLGAKHLSVEVTAPRIIFVPTGERITPSGSAGKNGEPRSLWMRHVNIDAHVWGKEIADVEKTCDRLMQAMHDIAAGSYRPTGGQWSTAAEVVTGWGYVFVLRFEVDIPITRRPDTYALVSALPLDPLTVETS